MQGEQTELRPDRLALEYYYSIPRYLLSRLLNRFWPRHFFPRVAPLRLRPVAFAPRPDWVVLRPRLVGICGSDLNLLKGAESYLLEPYASFPAVLGHEVVAEVASAPPSSGFSPGERVVVEPILACRDRGLDPCRCCAEGSPNLCENFTSGTLAPGPVLGFNRDAAGGMAELMAAPAACLLRLPPGLADEVAVLTDSLASALEPLLQNFPPAGATVVVYGAGIIGQHLVRLMRALGSQARVVAVARHDFQAELARAGGAETVLISPSRPELAAAVGGRHLPTTLKGGNVEGGADFFFDCVGSGSSLQEGLLNLRARGTYVLVGTAGAVSNVDLSSLWFRELTLTGSAMYGQGAFQGRPVRTYELAVEILSRGDYPVQGLVSHRFPLRAYRRAFATAMNKRRHQSMKVIFEIGN